MGGEFMGGERMRQAGAAKRRQEQEQEPPPDGASVEADLRRVIAEAAVSAAMMRRHDSAVEAAISKLERLAAECPDASRFGLLADGVAAQLVMLKLEGMGLAAHCAEARAACEAYAASASFTEAMRAAAFEAGRIAGVEEEQARQSRAPRGRHAARSRHLKVAGGIAASSAVAASLVAGSAVIASQDSAAVRHWSPSPVSVRMHAGPADSAVLVPPVPSRAYVPRHAKPSADAASASPAPSPSLPASASPSPSAPVSQPSAEASGILDVQTIQVIIGPDGHGKITFTAVGGPVWWQASSSSPAVVLGESGDRLAAGGPEVLTLNVAPGTVAGSAVVTITAGGQSVQVPVTWVAVPGLPL